MPNEEEYHLPGDSGEVAYQAAPDRPVEATPENVPKSGAKKIIIILVIVVGIWSAHHLYSMVKARSKPAQQNITSLTSEPLPLKPRAFQPAATTASKPVSAPVAFNAGPSVGMENRLANIEEGNAEAQAKIERTNANLAELQNTLTTVSSQIAALNNTIQDLSGQVLQQQAQIRSLTVMGVSAQKRQSHGGGAHAAPVKMREYFIQAAIPGRAWLTTRDGRTMTVSIGDAVPGYGEVSSINPNPGLVTTSSGKDIVFISGEN